MYCLQQVNEWWNIWILANSRTFKCFGWVYGKIPKKFLNNILNHIKWNSIANMQFKCKCNSSTLYWPQTLSVANCTSYDKINVNSRGNPESSNNFSFFNYQCIIPVPRPEPAIISIVMIIIAACFGATFKMRDISLLWYIFFLFHSPIGYIIRGSHKHKRESAP